MKKWKYFQCLILMGMLFFLKSNCTIADEIPISAKMDQIDNEYNVKTYRYRTDHNQKNRKWLTDCEYIFFEKMKIPGMPDTLEEDYSKNLIYTRKQCLQGLCITDNYALLTAYSQDKDVNSALIIMDRFSGKHLVTLGLDRFSHVGGITFDGEYVWICNSYDSTLSRIPFETVRKAADSDTDVCLDFSCNLETFSVENVPSCVTYYGGYLWVGTHSLYFNSEMSVYGYDRTKENLEKICNYKIPPKVQGIAFDQTGAILFSTSYGRRNSSMIIKYNSLKALAKDLNEPELEVEMPPCAEGITVVSGYAYVLFESANEKYYRGTDGKGISDAPLDRILVIKSI